MDFLRTISKGYQGQIRNILMKFMAPSMTTAERDALLNPEAGQIIWNATTSKLNVYNGSSWEQVTSV